MVVPYHKHLTWLCLEGSALEDVRAFYDNIQLPIPSPELFSEISAGAAKLPVPPAAKRRLAKRIYSDEDKLLWRRLGFEEIYLHRLGKSDWADLGKILNHPVMRVALECCLVAKVTVEEISQILPTVYYLPCSAGTVELFIKYFFDYEKLGRKDWQEYLYMISEDRYTHARIFAALTKSREEVMHLVGLPSKTKFGTMLKNVMTTANYRFEYFARQSSPEAQDEARKWAKILFDAGEKHEKFGATDMTDFGKVLQTEFEYTETQIEMLSPEMMSSVKPKLLTADVPTNNAPKPPEDPPVRPSNDI